MTIPCHVSQFEAHRYRGRRVDPRRANARRRGTDDGALGAVGAVAAADRKDRQDTDDRTTGRRDPEETSLGLSQHEYLKISIQVFPNMINGLSQHGQLYPPKMRPSYYL